MLALSWVQSLNHLLT